VRKNAEFYAKRETVLRARKLACPTDMESRPPLVLQDLKTGALCVKEISQNRNWPECIIIKQTGPQQDKIIWALQVNHF